MPNGRHGRVVGSAAVPGIARIIASGDERLCQAGRCRHSWTLSDCLTMLLRRRRWMPLEWGRRYVMVEPTHFRVDYVINPFMDPARPARPRPGHGASGATWSPPSRRLGGIVEVVPQRADAPDMVYAMNLGLAVVRPDGTAARTWCSHMRYPERRMETASAQQWFADRGSTTSYVGRDGVGAHLEAGDAFAFGDALVVGHGPRTEELALKHLRRRPGRAGARPADHPPRDVPPRPGLLPPRRPPRDGLPRRARRRLGRRAARRWCPSRWCSPRRRR